MEQTRLVQGTAPAYKAARMAYKDLERTAYLADADLMAEGELLLVQARSRHLHRNNGLINAAESKLVTKFGAITIVFHDETGAGHALAQELWDEWVEKCNLDGRGDFDTFQATINHDRIQSGEAIVRMVIVPVGQDEVRVPLRLQTIESEYLDITYRGFQSTEESVQNNTRYGITFDPTTNKPLKYWFKTENYYGHPNREEAQNSWQLQEVAGADICHIFERRRSNQWRGVPTIAAILQDVYGLEDLTDATILQQTNASALSWIVERDVGAAPNPSSLGSTIITKEYDKNLLEKLHFVSTGGSVQYTQPGERFHLVQSKDIGTNLITLLNHVIQTISTTYGLPYYMLSGNTDGLDFSSIRGVLLEFREYLEYCYNFIIIPDGLARIVNRFKKLAEISGYAVANAKPTYRFPKYYSVDPLKDAQANVLEMQSGARTIQMQLKENDITEEQYLKHIEFCKANELTHLISTAKSMTENNAQATQNSSSN